MFTNMCGQEHLKKGKSGDQMLDGSSRDPGNEDSLWRKGQMVFPNLGWQTNQGNSHNASYKDT